MMKSAWARVGLLILLTAARASADQARYLALNFGERDAWHTFADEPWWSQVDIRDMLNIFHPFSISKTGAAAGASHDVTIPADWQPPFSLRFYCADDYYADPSQKPGVIGTESFFDHRYKQIVIDGKVVWERDVIDENTMGLLTTFDVDISAYVKPGGTYKITFRAFDKVSTEQRNERDIWFRTGIWYAPGDGKTEQPPRFHTAVWFADPIIGEKGAVTNAPTASRPHDDVVAVRHKQRWPMPLRAMPLKFPAELKLVTPTTMPASGFPITCGVPMPPGLLKNAKSVQIADRAEHALPLQTEIGATWPDGSVRHLIVNTIAPGSAKNGDVFKLNIGGAKPNANSPLHVQQEGNLVTVDTGPLRLKLGSDPEQFIDEVQLAEQSEPLCTHLNARMTLGTGTELQNVSAKWQEIKVIDKGPVAARIELIGTLDAGAQHIGRFVFRLYAYAGLPTIQTQFRVINDVDADKPLQVSFLAIVASLPSDVQQAIAGLEDAESVRSSTGFLVIAQDSPDQILTATELGKNVHPTKGKSQGWISASNEKGCVQAAVRWFWELYPKSLLAYNDHLEIALFTPSEKEPFYLPNFAESKRHDIWFTFSPKPSKLEGDRTLATLADSPPRLFDSNWFCLSGAYDLLDPQWFEHQPKIAKWVKEAYGDVSSTIVLSNHFGLRDFGDYPHDNDGGQHWMNGYWAMIQSSLYWGLASGDPRWIDRSCEVARHVVDVDFIRIPPGHVDWDNWNGVTCALCTDHSKHTGTARWPAFQQGDNLFLHYWLTGDPDSREAAIANADYIIRSKAGVGAVEARSQARPMLTLLRAWQTTSDQKYLEGAKRYFDLKSQTDQIIDWRRGTYIQPIYANYRCVSAGLDSMYAHNIYEYYRLTGDVDAARLVVAVADSVYAESMLPQEEGIGSFYFYVRYDRGSWYFTQMAMLFYMAYDLTGDVRFLRAGRAGFDRYLFAPSYQNWANFGWLDPEFGGWLLEFKDIPTEPFHITNQTPDPDPANYR